MTTATMQPWLVNKLAADGILDPHSRLTSRLRPRRCTHCGAWTLACLDDLGIPTHLEPDPITSPGELFALLTSRATYALDRGEIYPRDHWHIQGRPADTEKTYVTHACHAPPIPANPRFVQQPRPAVTDVPPF